MKLLNNKRDVIACYRPFCQNKASPLFYHEHTRQSKPDPRTGSRKAKSRLRTASRSKWARSCNNF